MRGVLPLLRGLASAQGKLELRLIEGETFIQGVRDAPSCVLGQDVCNDLILHLSHSLDVLFGKLPRAKFEEVEVWLKNLRCALVFGCSINIFPRLHGVSLFDEIDECLGLHELFEKPSVLLHVLHVVSEVEDLVGAIASRVLHQAILVVEVFEGVDEENQKVQELLLHLQGELLPENFLADVKRANFSSF